MRQFAFQSEHSAICWTSGFIWRPNKAPWQPTVGWIALKHVAGSSRIFQRWDRPGPILIRPHATSSSRWLTLYEIVPGGVFVVRVVDAVRDLSEIDLSEA